jgi:hypothetical protein
MGLVISEWVRKKLTNKHCVTEQEIIECFMNRTSIYLEDTREEHKTEPPSKWFIAETDKERKLKTVFVLKDNKIFIKTAYELNQKEILIYQKYINN